MHKTLIGYTGFVGSNLMSQATVDATFNSKNIEESAGLTTDLLVVSGAPAVKWWANQNGEADGENIQKLIASVTQIKAKKVVLISTIDVYETTAGQDENQEPAPVQPYGLHRLQLERALQAHFSDVTVIRLPGLFGQGLKKNVIYDLMHDNQVQVINRASVFQWYDLSRLWSDINIALSHSLKVANLFPEPLETEALVARFFPDLRAQTARDETKRAIYGHRSVHAHLFGGADGYIQSKSEVLAGLRAYLGRSA